MKAASLSIAVISLLFAVCSEAKEQDLPNIPRSPRGWGNCFNRSKKEDAAD